MAKVILSLASNRFQAKNLSRARQCLEEIFSDLRYSREHWTEPVGNAKRRDAYLNQLATGTTTLDEETLNERLKQMELSFGRTQAKRLLGIVPIDLDILQYDDERRHLLDWQRPYVTELIGNLFNSPPESGGARGGLNTPRQSENCFFRPPLTPPNLGGENDTPLVRPSHEGHTDSPPESGGARGGLNNLVQSEERLFRPPLTPPDSGGENDTPLVSPSHEGHTDSPPESGGAKGGLNNLVQSEERLFRPPLTPPNSGGESGSKGLNTSYISKRHNQQEQTLLRKTLRNNATAPEALLWMKLKGKQIDGLKFRRQFGVGPYVIDFYCPELRLGIELDGEIHNRFDTEMHDNIRTAFLRENRIMLLRYKNEVVYQNVDAIIEDIRQFYRNTLNQASPN
jgi:2-amino-4-hydroxy-6-hydroxymethyldihydropteridine diphosphokinase